MTGILKKHRASYAAEGVRLWYDNANNRSARNATGVGRQGVRCPTIISIDGTEFHYIFGSRGYSGNYSGQADIAGYNERSFTGLTAFATADLLQNWSIDDHEINQIGSTSQSQGCMFNDVVMQQVYTINIVNNSVDHYEQNTDPVFVPNKFYEKDGNNYILLTELPSGVDWSIDYANYYVLVEAADITVKCIRFQKNYCLCSDNQWDSNTSSAQYIEKQCLAYSYYLDEPITISPGNTHTLTVKFSPTED